MGEWGAQLRDSGIWEEASREGRHGVAPVPLACLVSERQSKHLLVVRIHKQLQTVACFVPMQP